jgi:hypothetical protein
MGRGEIVAPAASPAVGFSGPAETAPDAAATLFGCRPSTYRPKWKFLIRLAEPET